MAGKVADSLNRERKEGVVYCSNCNREADKDHHLCPECRKGSDAMNTRLRPW